MWIPAASRYYIALEKAHKAGFHVKGDSLHPLPHATPDACRLWNEAYEALREYMEAVNEERTLDTKKRA